MLIAKQVTKKKNVYTVQNVKIQVVQKLTIT